MAIEGDTVTSLTKRIWGEGGEVRVEIEKEIDRQRERESEEGGRKHRIVILEKEKIGKEKKPE